MPKIGDIIVTVDAPKFSKALDDVNQNMGTLGDKIQSVTMPLSLYGSLYHLAAIQEQDEQIRRAAMEAYTGLTYADIERLNNTPLDIEAIKRQNWEFTVDNPVARWEYQKGVIMTPYYWILDIIDKFRS